MAYWGYKTPANFGVWLTVAVLLITGAVWLIIGVITGVGCGYCHSELGTSIDPADADADMDKGCLVALYAFNLYEPDQAIEPDAKDNFYRWCMTATGPMAQLIAGGTMFITGLLLLSYFCCCAAKPGTVISGV